MIRKFNILLLTLLMIIVGVSCEEEYLETAPTDAISASDALSTPENMMLVIHGLHSLMYTQNPLPDNYWHVTGQSHILPMYDFLTGNMIHSAPGNGWMRYEAQWLRHTSATDAYIEYIWYQMYHFVNSTNLIIDAVENGDFVMDEEMNNILGQAHAYRAWAFHQLVMNWGKGYLIGNPATDPGVPLRIASGAPYDGGPRATVQEVYDQVIEDIDKAITYLEAGNSPSASNGAEKSHISANAAYGIKARVHLSMGDWAAASTAANAALAGYSVMGEADWKVGFNQLALPEVIWGGRVIGEETNYFAAYFYYICPTFNGSQNRGNPKLFPINLYNQMGVNDYRRDAVLPLAPNTNPAASNGEGGSSASDPNYTNETDFWNAWASVITTWGMTTGHHTHPYMHVKFLQQNPGTIDPDDVIYMRASEMYLIIAEAEAMQGNLGPAITALRTVADERNPDWDSTVEPTLTDQTAVMNEIKFQRKVELYGEGFSWHDMIRWDEEKDMTGTGASQVLYQDGWQQARPSVNNLWIWKIPQREIDANPHMTNDDQNPD